MKKSPTVWSGVRGVAIGAAMVISAFASAQPAGPSVARQWNEELLEAIRNDLLAYYRGLAKSVLAGKGVKADPAEFTFAMEKVEEVKLLLMSIYSFCTLSLLILNSSIIGFSLAVGRVPQQSQSHFIILKLIVRQIII